MSGNNPANPTMIEFESDRGLTKREIMAMHAMTGLLAQSRGSATVSDARDGAEFCVKMADALLAELNK